MLGMGDGIPSMTQPRPQQRYARALLLLTILHTVPVIWITPVAGGTAPTSALLAVGLASLFTFEPEGVVIALFALAPAAMYCAIAGVLAWLVARGLETIQQPQRAILLAVVSATCLLSVYLPIYVTGNHNGSRSVNLVGLFSGTGRNELLLVYWIGIHILLLALFVGYTLRDQHPVITFIEHWRKPAVTTISAAVLSAIVVGNYPIFICRPLVELGSGRATLCVARSDRQDQRYWYERAAEQNQTEAIAWMIAHTPSPTEQLYWLRKGAELGDAAIQFQLYARLLHRNGAITSAETEMWLLRAAQGDHAAAQVVLAEKITRALDTSYSTASLAERNRWLERAARLGERDARRRLAHHYIDGSMGYTADLRRARAIFEQLAKIDQPTRHERILGLDAAYYRARIVEIESWESALHKNDPTTTKLFAELYLKSRFPGPGVRERGLTMTRQLAESGDMEARNALIALLTNGAPGVAKDLVAAKRWLIAAAEAGDVIAMEKIARNYTTGRNGFVVDYPVARRWLLAAVEVHQSGDSHDAHQRIQALQNELQHVDRIAQQAGGELLGAHALEELGQRNDAESHYQYAAQLLAGYGPTRRSEAIARLDTASRLGHAEAAWRLFQIYEKGFPSEINHASAINQLKQAAANHHFDAIRELAMRYEYGKGGLSTDLPLAIAMYEAALAAGHDNRYGWNLDHENFSHFTWLESRLRQARMKHELIANGE